MAARIRSKADALAARLAGETGTLAAPLRVHLAAGLGKQRVLDLAVAEVVLFRPVANGALFSLNESRFASLHFSC